MLNKIGVAICCVALLGVMITNVFADSEASRSSGWSALVHEENSVWASILYLPYLVGQLPGRIIDGIFNPKPASRATVPPPAHQEGRY